MQVIRLYALRSERKALLEQLQRLGAVEITDSLELDGAIPEGFTRIDREEEAGTFDRMAASARQALEILDEYAPAKKGMLASLSGRREVSEQEFSACAEKSREVMAVCNEVQALRKKAAEGAAELVRIRSAQAQLEPWMPAGCAAAVCRNGENHRVYRHTAGNLYYRRAVCGAECAGMGV